MSTETMTKPVKKVITVGTKQQPKSTGVPIWTFPSERQGSKPTEYTICVTESAHSYHRAGKLATKGQFNPKVVEGSAPHGWVPIGKVTAKNVAEALDLALDSFYSIYVEGDVNH